MGQLSSRKKKNKGTDRLEQLLDIADKSNLEPPKQKPTALERIVGALRASETSGLVNDFIKGKGIGESLGNYGKRIGKGWTGQGLTKEDLGVEGYADILKEQGVSDTPWFELGPIKPTTAGTLGLIGDIALDPLTYVGGIGGLTKAGKTASKVTAAKATKELAEKSGVDLTKSMLGKANTKIMEFAGEGVEPLGKTAAEQASKGQKSLLTFMGKSVVPKKVNEFVFKTRDKALNKLGDTQVGATIDSFRKIFSNDMVELSAKGTDKEGMLFSNKIASDAARNVEKIVQSQSGDYAKEYMKAVKSMAGKDREKAASIMSDVIDAVETKSVDKISDPQVKALAEKATNFRNYLEDVWTKVGGSQLADEEIGYWVHTLSPDMREKLASNMGLGTREFTDKIVAEQVRKYVKLVDADGNEVVGNIDQLKKLRGIVEKDGNLIDSSGRMVKIKSATIKEINEALGEKKFSTELGYTAYLMGSRVGKKAAGVTYLNLIQGLGKKAEQAPDNWVPSTAKFLKDQGLVFPPEVAKHVDKTYKAYFSDEALKDVINIYDKIQGMWKTSVTSLFPAFHVRNKISNIWANYLGDVKNPKVYLDADRILITAKTKGMEALSEGDRALYQSYLDNGLSGFGFFGGDIAKDSASEFTTKSAIKNFIGTPKRRGMKIGNFVEDEGKLAHFIDKVRKGYSSQDAASSVRKYLFDYSDLTDTEKYVFKRVAPFYTFTRKNIPMELEALITKPGKFSNLQKTMRASGYDPNVEGVPSYMREQPAYNIGNMLMSGGSLGLPAFEPLEMIGETPGRSIEKTASKLLSPLLKVPMENTMDRSMYYGKPLSETNTVDKLWGEKIEELGMSDKFGLQKVKGSTGDYYVTTNPQLWNTMKAVFSRIMTTASSIDRLSSEDINKMYSFANFMTGVSVRKKDGAVDSAYKKELEKKLYDFLYKKGKVYEFSLYREPKK